MNIDKANAADSVAEGMPGYGYSTDVIQEPVAAIRAIPRDRLYAYPANDAAGSSESFR